MKKLCLIVAYHNFILNANKVMKLECNKSVPATENGQSEIFSLEFVDNRPVGSEIVQLV